MTDRHSPFPRTADRNIIQSGKNVELIQITTSSTTAKQITFTNWVKKILLYNTSADAAEIVNLLDASTGTIGLPIQPSANAISLDVAGEGKLNLWVKSASGAPVLTVVGIF